MMQNFKRCTSAKFTIRSEIENKKKKKKKNNTISKTTRPSDQFLFLFL